MATHNVPIPRASFGTTLAQLCSASSPTTLEYAIRYKTQADADHLIHTLEQYEYKLKVRPLGDVYLGMAISFDRPNKTVSISMPGYVKKMLQRFRPQYLLPGHRPPRTPGVYIAPSFNKKPQTVFIDRSEKLSPALITELQAIIGTLLYYARAVDPTLLPIANELASQQANATRRILSAANRALSYCTASSNNQIVYHACDMALHVFADASCLIPLPVPFTLGRRRYIFPWKPQ